MIKAVKSLQHLCIHDMSSGPRRRRSCMFSNWQWQVYDIAHDAKCVQHSAGLWQCRLLFSSKPLLSLMRDQVASLTKHNVTAAMIGAGLFEDKQIQRSDVSVVFGSPLEKRPPTESIPQSRHCCCCRRSSLRRSEWLACFC